MADLCFSIAAVERDTGLSKDVLRMWERRYGFPIPHRVANGERSYPLEQVERLRLIKRLIDLGHRPGKLIGTPPEELSRLIPARPVAVESLGAAEATEIDSLLALIKQHDIEGYQRAMQQCLARKGLERFVQDIVAQLADQVGGEWEQGRLEVFEEHLFTELTKRVLRQAMASLPGGKRGPRILLTSVPGEQHVLGLLMVEALFALEGAECIPLGTETPLLEIARAATAHGIDIVALSFSSAYPQRQIPGALQQLRKLLPSEMALWSGGSGVLHLSAIEDVLLLQSLDDAKTALGGWRAATQ